MKPLNKYELGDAVEAKKITSVKLSDGSVRRLFVATNGVLCYFTKGKKRSGYQFTEDMFNLVIEFNAPKGEKTEDEQIKAQYNRIVKYKKLAIVATFTNRFIENCKKLPDFESWLKDKITPSYPEDAQPRQKCLYDLGITTGNGIDGKVISIDRIAKQYPYYAQRLREAIKNQSEGTICTNTPFAGYDMSLSTAKKETGEFMGYLSLEYKGCGNGYYYLLINDDNFIGYDVD